MSVFLLQGIAPTGFKRTRTNDILVSGAHIDGFNGAYSLSPIPTLNPQHYPEITNLTKNYLHTTNSGYRMFFHEHWQWVLASNVPSPVDAKWNYASHADAYYSMQPEFLGEMSVFPPDPQTTQTLIFGGQADAPAKVVTRSENSVEVIRARNVRFNGAYEMEGTYNDRPYFRKGSSGYGIIYCSRSYLPEDPQGGAYDNPAWFIVDDLPPAPFAWYYAMDYVTSYWYDPWETSTHDPTEVGEFTGDYKGDARNLSLTITEINL